MESQGSSYLRWDYSVPAGYLGTRAGVQTSNMTYKLVGDFSALQASGNSGGWGAYSTTPLLRSINDNLLLNLSYDEKSFKNFALSNSAPALVSDYTLSVWRATLNRSWYDEIWGYALNNWTITASTGQVNLGGSPNQADDAQFAHTAGEFNKFNLSWSRQQFLSERMTLAATLTGQAASRNLDSSEKMYLGGPTGVRAYPVNEVGGSVGQTLNLELRERLDENWTISGFYDYGQVYVYANNQKADGGILTTQNQVALEGLGLSLVWQNNNGLRASVTWSHRNGSNPAANSLTGADSDGTHEMDRYWFTLAVMF
jgi:hemolysin activation/secretion protein